MKAENGWKEPLKWQGDMLHESGRRLWQSRCVPRDSAAYWFGETPWGDFSQCRPITMQDVRDRLFALIAATPNLDWLVSTKYPENIAKMTPRRIIRDSQPIFPGAPGKLGEPLPCIVEGGVRPNVFWVNTDEWPDNLRLRVPTSQIA